MAGHVRNVACRSIPIIRDNGDHPARQARWPLDTYDNWQEKSGDQGTNPAAIKEYRPNERKELLFP